MFQTFVEFEIVVGALQGAVYPLHARCVLSGEGRATFTLPTDALFQSHLAQLAQLETTETMLQQLGERLFAGLFHGEIRTIYDKARAQIDQDGKRGLRLKLQIDASEAEVGALPWELIYDPDNGPLALLDVPLVRYLPRQDAPATQTAELPLKVLLTGAQTPPQPNVARELSTIREALVQLEQAGQVQIEVVEHLTSAILQEKMRADYDIWHFIGHGHVTEDGSARTLQFETESGGTARVSAAQLRILMNRSSVRLVVLSACESGSLAAVEPLRSVAPALIGARIPTVVAMQFKVPQSSTRAFAYQFYKTLAEGFPIDSCVTEGRKAVMNNVGLEFPDWAIPVVYTRAPDGRLIDRKAVSTTNPPAVLLPTSQPAPTSKSIPPQPDGPIPPGLFDLGGLPPPSAASDPELYEARSTGLQTEVTHLKNRLHHFQVQLARDPNNITTKIEAEELQRSIDDKRNELLTLRKGRLLASSDPDEIAELRLMIIEEAIALKQAALPDLERRIKIQASATGREKARATFDEAKRELIELNTLLQKLKG
jgi:hypothetical protein